MKYLIPFLLLAIFAGQVWAEDRTITIVNHEFRGTKQWIPGTIIVNKGDKVTLKLINKAPSGKHNFSIPAFKINETIDLDKTNTVSFEANKKGIFKITCGLHKAHVGGQLFIN